MLEKEARKEGSRREEKKKREERREKEKKEERRLKRRRIIERQMELDLGHQQLFSFALIQERRIWSCD